MSLHLARGAIGGGIVAAGLLLAGTALAGDNNSASLFQSGSGNSLFTDQSQASNSLLGLGTNPFGSSGDNRLSQVGVGNTAYIGVTGGALTPLSDAQGNVQGNAFLRQQGLHGGIGSNNSATINIEGSSVGSVSQNGTGNTAALTVKGGAQGAIEQSGNSNVAGLTVSGANVLYRQIGDGLSTATSGFAVSSGAIPTITITSSSLPGVPGMNTGVSGTAPITITQTN